MQNTEYSKNTGNFELPGRVEGQTDKYVITLLNVQATFKLQFMLGNQIKFAMSDKGIDPDLMWNLATKLLKFGEVNGYELSESTIEEHFQGRVEMLDRAVVEALKLNLPGFTKQLTGLLVKWITKASASASELSDLTTSKQVTGQSEKQSSR